MREDEARRDAAATLGESAPMRLDVDALDAGRVTGATVRGDEASRRDGRSLTVSATPGRSA